MPKQKDIRELLVKQIEELEKKLTVSHASLVYYQTEVRAQETELTKSRNALASLDGTTQTAPHAGTSSFGMGMEREPLRIRSSVGAFAAPNGAKPETVTINGDEVVLEPGFHVEKNSFGEDCIVPDGVKYASAAEPPATPDSNTRLGAGVIPLPAVTSVEQFDDPADIISAELPNG